MTIKSLNLKFAMGDLSAKPDGYIAGIASTSDVDRGDDIVAPNAFAASIADRGMSGPRAVKMLWQHDADKPCGSWMAMAQTAAGLEVEGQLNLKTNVGAQAYEHIKAGEVGSLSVGFRTISRQWDEDTQIRTILKGDLWEVSPVTFAMNENAQIHTVKGVKFEIEDGDNLSAIVKKLAPSCGLSRREADGVVDALKAMLRADPSGKLIKNLATIESAGDALKALFRTDPNLDALKAAIGVDDASAAAALEAVAKQKQVDALQSASATAIGRLLDAVKSTRL
jgi:HK97 family phage prohead protease